MADVAVDFPVGTADETRVLAVDDDPRLVELTETYLETLDEDFEVVTEQTAADALDRLDRERVDCVVSDHDMPEGDGIELLEAVRERDADLPFVLFTSRGSEEVASDAISAGVTDYLQKGGAEQYELLANRIANVVQQSRRGRALEGRRRQLDTLVDTLPGMVYRASPEPPWLMPFAGGAVESLTGYAPTDFERGDVAFGDALIVDADAEAVTEAVFERVSAGAPFEVTYRIRTGDGALKRVWECGTPRFEGGDVVALEGFVMDLASVPDTSPEPAAIG
ncbi:response regulator [Halobacterium litoreum]|uniref:Response regulator n=1 Tax=Halobacterium litoreum TaxID=2039234 RepID=A0ABD5NBX9_9EURY|nr:response regulator [Halobacterium litoreum]UHH14346.1 response regulator [Halobacterium litoreum]